MPVTDSNLWSRASEGHPSPPVDTAAAAVRAVAGKRPDIQGLRAFAVGLVILDHLALWPHGGFIGVDVFFVISGFLITGLLVRAAQSGRSVVSYFGYFYSRRARRILPAALVTLAACWVAADIAFNSARAGTTHTDILWALFFAANIHFANLGTDYFAQSAPPSLVQHFWSLAVEEQFYVVWPIVVILVLLVIGRRGRAASEMLLVVAVVTTVASFSLALHESVTNPTSAYFSTLSRAWELGVGATLALVLGRWPALSARLGPTRGPLMLAGVVGIVVSAAAIGAGTGFPAPAAAVPVLATALVIFAGSGASAVPRLWTLPLNNPVCGYLGDISFSLYLWHWPVILLTGAYIERKDWIYFPIVLCLTLGISMLSYHFVELPFQHGRLRSLGGALRPRTAAAVGVALLLVAAAAYTFKPAPRSPHYATGPVLLKHKQSGAEIAPASKRLTKAINSALAATTFPDLHPGLNGIGQGVARQTLWNRCRTTTSVLPSCTFGTPLAQADPNKTVLLLGDSMIWSWIPAVTAALAPMGWTIVGFAHGECSAADVRMSYALGASYSHECDAHHAAVPDIINQLHPSLVVLSSSERDLSELYSNAHGKAAAAEYQQGMVNMLRTVQAPGRDVVVLAPPPKQISLLDCDNGDARPADCVGKIRRSWRLLSNADRGAAIRTGARYIETWPWFCNNRGYCPAFIDGVPVTYDGGHMTSAYAHTLRKPMRRVLLGK